MRLLPRNADSLNREPSILWAIPVTIAHLSDLITAHKATEGNPFVLQMLTYPPLAIVSKLVLISIILSVSVLLSYLNYFRIAKIVLILGIISGFYGALTNINPAFSILN